MSTQIERTSRCAATNASRAERIERSLQRFRPEVQHRLRRLAAQHPWIADLAVSFPALLFALALPRANGQADTALQMVIAGAPLSASATAAGIPLWLRAFPGEAFASPIPVLPDGTAFRRRIANHWPKPWRNAPTWLSVVSHAGLWGDDDIALWMAREAPLARPPTRKRRSRRHDRSRLVCLWAWFSDRAETEAGTLIETRWNAEMRWASALAAAQSWIDALNLTLWLGAGGVRDAWVEAGVVDAYSFTPLLSCQQIIAEANAMQHCVASYGYDLATNYCRLWSVRKDGDRVATLSLEAAQPCAPLPHIAELSGKRSASVPAEVWLAARRWVHGQDALPVLPNRLAAETARIFDARAWRQTWRPYWLAKRHIPDWLPLTPTAGALSAI